MIFEEFEARRLSPLLARTASAQRNRRQLQFGILALIGLAVSQVADFLADAMEQPVWYALGVLGFLVAAVSLAALLWANAWDFGDERAADH